MLLGAVLDIDVGVGGASALLPLGLSNFLRHQKCFTPHSSAPNSIKYPPGNAKELHRAVGTRGLRVRGAYWPSVVEWRGGVSKRGCVKHLRVLFCACGVGHII